LRVATSPQGCSLIVGGGAERVVRVRKGGFARRTVEDLYGSRAWHNKLAYFVPSEREALRLPTFDAFDPTPSRIR
jgi:hypothetical protein